MKLRCAPGDLCRILSGRHKDHFITVKQLDPQSVSDGDPAWEYQGTLLDADPGFVLWSFCSPWASPATMSRICCWPHCPSTSPAPSTSWRCRGCHRERCR